MFPARSRLALLCALTLIALSPATPALAGSFGWLGDIGERTATNTPGQFVLVTDLTTDPVNGDILTLDEKRENGVTENPKNRYWRVQRFTSAGALPDPPRTLTLFATAKTTSIGDDFVGKRVEVDRTTNSLFVAMAPFNPKGGDQAVPAEIWRYDLNATGTTAPTAKYPITRTVSGVPDVLDTVRDMTIDPATGNLYVTGSENSTYEEQGEIWQIDPAADLATASVVRVRQLADVTELTADDAPSLAFGTDALFVRVTQPTPQRAKIVKLNPDLTLATDGPLVATEASTGDRPIPPSSTIAVEPSGAVLVAAGQTREDGVTNSGYGVQRYTSLSSSLPERYFANAKGSEGCTFDGAQKLLLAYNRVTSEIIAYDHSEPEGASPVDLRLRRIKRFGANGNGCGFEAGKADFSVSASPAAGADITFTSLSTLPQQKPAYTGSFSALKWFFDGEATPGATGASATRKLTKGDHQVRLVAELSTGGSVETTKTVKVSGPPPTAAFVTSVASPRVGDTVTFDGTSSTAVTGTTLKTYRWDLDGDGTFESTGATVSRAYTSARSYRVKLEVEDSTGEKDTQERTLVVSAAPSAPAPAPAPTPIVPAASDLVAPVLVLPAGSIRVDRKGAFTYALSCPAGETSCSFQIAATSTKAIAAAKKRKVALVTGTATIAGGAGAKVKLKLTSAGLKAVRKLKRVPATFTVKVTDASGNSATATRATTILAAKRR